MKKWALLFLAIILVVGGYFWARNQRYVMPWNMPKIVKVNRGDIRVPISAAGIIEPNQKIEIKSKASGEIIEIPVAAGDFVHIGDVLIKLKQDEELRNKDRAESDLIFAKSGREGAKLSIDKAKQFKEAADAELDVLKAQEPVARKEYEQAIEMKKTGGWSPLDEIMRKASLEQNLANQKGAGARARQAELNIREAEISLDQQEENVRKAEKLLGDANERLDETTIMAKMDAIVTEVKVRVGERIQGAQTTFTGGTPLIMLADVSKLKVIARVDEADYGRILDIAPVIALPQLRYREDVAKSDAAALAKRSGKVKLSVESFRDEDFEGVIERVEPQGRLNLGSSVIQFDVHVAITGENRSKLPLGAQAQVEFTVQSVQNVLTVAADAVKSFENQHGVWLVIEPLPGEHAKGKRFIPCKIGITDGENTQIIEALMGEKLDEGVSVYTRLPVEPKEDM